MQNNSIPYPFSQTAHKGFPTTKELINHAPYQIATLRKKIRSKVVETTETAEFVDDIEAYCEVRVSDWVGIVRKHRFREKMNELVANHQGEVSSEKMAEFETQAAAFADAQTKAEEFDAYTALFDAVYSKAIKWVIGKQFE